MEENKTGFVDKYYKIILILIFLTGILIRSYLYICNQSLWLDEASLAINVVNEPYKNLFEGLKLLQACPPGFTIITKFLVDFVNTENLYTRDLILRVIPFTSGVLSVFAFYYLLKLIFPHNKSAVLTALAFLTFNPAAITYSVQFKQYSLELFLGIILLTIFYKMLILNKNKKYYPVIIAISPWFSYSAFFIIASGLLALLFKNKKDFLLISVITLISCVIYYLVSLKSVFELNYSGMDAYWSLAYSFLEINHPTRLFYRIGDLFTMYKIPSLIAGIICSFALICYLANKEHKLSKILFIFPVVLTIAASMLHRYPFCCRLILFLLPMLLITLAGCKIKGSSILKIITALILVFSLFSYKPDAKEYCYAYGRYSADYVKKHIKKDETIILDEMKAEYVLYLNGYNQNNIITFPTTCLFDNIEKCTDFVKKLPRGGYYFLASSYYAREIVEYAGLKPIELDLGFKPKKCKAVYFEKN